MRARDHPNLPVLLSIAFAQHRRRVVYLNNQFSRRQCHGSGFHVSNPCLSAKVALLCAVADL